MNVSKFLKACEEMAKEVSVLGRGASMIHTNSGSKISLASNEKLINLGGSWLKRMVWRPALCRKPISATSSVGCM